MNSQEFHSHIQRHLNNRGYHHGYSCTTYLSVVNIELDMADDSKTAYHTLPVSTNEFIVIEDIELIDSHGLSLEMGKITIKSEDRTERYNSLSAIKTYPFKPIHKGQCVLSLNSNDSGTINIPYIIITPNYDSSRRKKNS